jgi:hypothetical protein
MQQQTPGLDILIPSMLKLGSSCRTSCHLGKPARQVGHIRSNTQADCFTQNEGALSNDVGQGVAISGDVSALSQFPIKPSHGLQRPATRPAGDFRYLLNTPAVEVTAVYEG